MKRDKQDENKKAGTYCTFLPEEEVLRDTILQVLKKVESRGESSRDHGAAQNIVTPMKFEATLRVRETFEAAQAALQREYHHVVAWVEDRALTWFNVMRQDGEIQFSMKAKLWKGFA